MRNRLSLSFASLRYDHFADLMIGSVVPEGIDLTYLELPYHDVLLRSVLFADFDVAEISMTKYAALRCAGETSLVAIPVFPNRMCRLSAVYVRADGSVHKPEDLAGRRIGVPEWAQTATVYFRGMLQHYYGVDLRSIAWTQAGADEPGRAEKVVLQLPEGLKLAVRADTSLSDLLPAGELDAIVCGQPPRCYNDRHPNVRRLFDDTFDAEWRYVEETGIYPIMHVIVIKGALLERAPWVAANLYAAFQEAKRRSVERALFTGASMYPVPFEHDFAKRTKTLLGDDIFPYGVEPNRVTLEAFLDYLVEQGICSRRMQLEELFAPQTLVHAAV
jgi:4,5-dihydroxyphthalate decarboxylase